MSKWKYRFKILGYKLLLIFCRLIAYVDKCTLSFLAAGSLCSITLKILFYNKNISQIDFFKIIIIYLFMMFLSIIGAIFKIDAYKKEMEFYKENINKMINRMKESYGNSNLK